MQLRYDEELIEGATRLCANGRCEGVSSLQILRFHCERERLYAVVDPDEQNAAFFKLHLEWFREWRLEKLLTDLLNEFPSLQTSLNILAFRKARGRNDEGAELYVSAETGRNGVVALRPERFEDEDQLGRFLRHELTHIGDMVDPAFDYRPQLHLPGQNAAQQRLTRERYRLLWDITIDGRLTGSGQTTGTTREQHRAGFDRTYGFWSEGKREVIFETLWHGRRPCHGEMLALASDPRGANSANAPLPGAACPLCGFPTFHWAEASQPGEITELIVKEFPAWTSEQGACNRCVQVYGSALRLQRTGYVPA